MLALTLWLTKSNWFLSDILEMVYSPTSDLAF
ncbi:MAG: Unknown protein [uncultured Thiotrichaceae bacterium]|uniref:Uncharacterized protein n=1 Tax=uncultured Thiotrichaceae bacterium TaxID=298394 RepID=A0A6S6TI37_9GAMM|nr:MAG: Unknown protein [uncultured Thiotrichaceae bacterium]